jgi:hypothetical protein
MKKVNVQRVNTGNDRSDGLGIYTSIEPNLNLGFIGVVTGATLTLKLKNTVGFVASAYRYVKLYIIDRDGQEVSVVLDTATLVSGNDIDVSTLNRSKEWFIRATASKEIVGEQIVRDVHTCIDGIVDDVEFEFGAFIKIGTIADISNEKQTVKVPTSTNIAFKITGLPNWASAGATDVTSGKFLLKVSQNLTGADRTAVLTFTNTAGLPAITKTIKQLA